MSNVHPILFTSRQSRYRRAARMDAIGVGLLLTLITAIGVIAAPAARADDEVSYTYAATFGGVVCNVLDDYPTTAGMLGIGQAIMDDGLTAHQAGEVLAISVREICPRHFLLLRRFITTYAGSVPGTYA